MEPPKDEESARVIRLVLRRPEAVQQVEDLSATPQVFDTLFSKPYYAHQLRLAGHDWPVVARKLGYQSAHVAEKAVHTWLTKTIEGRAKDFAATRSALQAEAISLDLERLDRLQAAYWEEAINGDIPSANFCLRVIAQRSRYLAPEAGPGITNTINTLVVGGSESEYVGALLKARESLGPASHKVIEAGSDDEADVVD